MSRGSDRNCDRPFVTTALPTADARYAQREHWTHVSLVNTIGPKYMALFDSDLVTSCNCHMKWQRLWLVCIMICWIVQAFLSNCLNGNNHLELRSAFKSRDRQHSGRRSIRWRMTFVLNDAGWFTVVPSDSYLLIKRHWNINKVAAQQFWNDGITRVSPYLVALTAFAPET